VKEPPIQRLPTNSARSESLGEAAPKDAPADLALSSTRTIPFPIHFIKSSCFRVVHASGAWYGGDSQKNLHLTFFNERTPIPKKVVVNLNEQGMVVGEDLSERITKEGAVREMEVDIVFSIPSAVEFYKTLGENLKALKAI
jgi:hypothetical protein